MTEYEKSIEMSEENASYQHLDYYVRRYDGELVLVQTMMKEVDGNTEIVTFYINMEELEPEWIDAVLEQGEGLEEGKSADFVPPDELHYYEYGYESDDE